MKHNNLIGLGLAGAAIVGGLIWANIRAYHPKPWPVQQSATQQTQVTPQNTPQSTSVPPPAFDKTQYSLDDPASMWVVVDKRRPLNPRSYAPTDLTAVGNGQYLRAAAAEAFARMVADAKTAGYSLSAESGYRSYDTQVSVYGNEVKNYGQAVADSESARPGFSEHQTGWSVDIASPGCIEDCFGTTAAATWVLANSAKYGFFQRYPDGKSAVTGYRHESWHFRYVGPALAAEIVKSSQTMEEYFGLPAAPDYL